MKNGNTLKGECEGRLMHCTIMARSNEDCLWRSSIDLLILTFLNMMENILQVMAVRRDKDGYYWITGRVDDVIIVSGHNLGTAEIESAFVAHSKVAEAAVVGYPHDIKGKWLVLLCYFKRWRNRKCRS